MTILKILAPFLIFFPPFCSENLLFCLIWLYLVLKTILFGAGYSNLSFMIRNIYIFLTFVILSSCYKDDLTTKTTIIKNDPRYIVESGRMVIEVADENGQSLSGLTASYNGDIKIVNQSSFFEFEGKNVNRFEELLRITDKEGFEYDYLIQSQAGEVNYTKVNVFRNKKQSIFDSSADKELPLFSDAKISLPQNNYLVNVTNQYTGTVEVRYTHYDIKNPNHKRSLPGGVLGIKDNQKWLLSMEDAFEFVLFSADKQKLNLRNPVAFLSQSTKKGSLLFYYDPQSHTWIYQAEVDASGQVMISRPGIYCIADISDFSIVTGQWMINELPARQMPVTLNIAGTTTEVITTNNGKWEALLPKGQNLEISYISACATTSKTQILLSENTVFAGIHQTTTDDIKPYVLSGRFEDCEGNALPSGFIKIQSSQINQTLFIDSSSFLITLPLCKNDPVDITFTNAASDFETHTFVNIPERFVLETIFLCPDLKENYVVMRLDGDHTIYTGFQKTVTESLIQIGGGLFSEKIFLKFGHQNIAGNLPLNKANISWLDEEIAGYGVDLKCPTSSNCGFTDVEITYFDQNRKILRVRFEGRFWLRTLNPVSADFKNISGEFQLTF